MKNVEMFHFDDGVFAVRQLEEEGEVHLVFLSADEILDLFVMAHLPDLESENATAIADLLRHIIAGIGMLIAAAHGEGSPFRAEKPNREAAATPTSL